MNRILVTGGAGFIGSNFVHHALQVDANLQIFNLDALTYAGSPENLEGLPQPQSHSFLEGDIRDKKLVAEVLQGNRIDCIVHFAAESHVDRSIEGPAPFIETNIFGTFSLLEAARQVWDENGDKSFGNRRFIHVSTDEVYGSLTLQEPAFRETNRYQPNSPYAASKASSDHLVRSYHHTYGLPAVITNCSNNYGPRQFPEKLIPLMIFNALAGEPLPIYGDGQQIRDWLYVEDHCRALMTVMKEGEIGETYNIGGDNQPTNLELVQQLCEILDTKVPNSPHKPHDQLITFVKDRPGHDRRYAMDITKIQSELGWMPQEQLESGLRKTIDWYLDNPDWVEAIRHRGSYQQWVQQNYGERTAQS